MIPSHWDWVFAVKLLGGPNEDSECGSEWGSVNSKNGNSILKGLERSHAAILQEARGKDCGERWKQEGPQGPHPHNLQDPGLHAAGKGETPRSLSQENDPGKRTSIAMCGSSHLQSPGWPWDPVSKQSKWTGRNRCHGDQQGTVESEGGLRVWGWEAVLIRS